MTHRKQQKLLVVRNQGRLSAGGPEANHNKQQQQVK